VRISTSWQYQQSVNNMQNQQSALDKAQNQVSTGLRINVASDDPAGAGQVVSLSHTMASNTQYSTNINAATTSLNTEASALTAINSALDSAQTLAKQAINGTMSASNRQAIASQLQQIHDQLVELANSTDGNGNALFAGTSTVKTPFQIGGTGAVTYLGNSAQQATSVGIGLTMVTSDPGSAIFMNVPAGNGTFTASAGVTNTGTLLVGANSVVDQAAWNASVGASGGSYTISFNAAGNWSATNASGAPVLDSTGAPVGGAYKPGQAIQFNGMQISLDGTPAAGDTVNVQAGGHQDVFSTLTNMIAVLNSGAGDTQTANVMSRQIESLDQVQMAVSNTQVSIGGRLNTLQQQSSSYSDLNVTYQSQLKNVAAADPYQAISDLSTQKVALQASQQVFAKLGQLSLFDYIR